MPYITIISKLSGMKKRGQLFYVPVMLFCVLLYYISLQFGCFSRTNSGLGHKKIKLPKTEKYQSDYVNSRLIYNLSEDLRPPVGRHEILWWNEPGWVTNEQFNEHCTLSYCKYSNCMLSWNKSRIEQSSAVIISIVDAGTEDVPLKRKHYHQPWIFFSIESPYAYLSDIDTNWTNVFNWSMTYHRDADIFVPYGRLEDRIPPLKDYSEIYRIKTKQAAWIVSHCETFSLREKYIKILQKYIHVDIYGACGKPIQRTEASLQKLLSKYKFYLSFENAFCRDYFTEKYFRYHKFDLIPVVRGLADYNNVLPNKTFINTADFQSIESLGNYLKRLSRNKDEYIKYLREKDKYIAFDHYVTYCDAFCTICEKVNNLPDTRKSYKSVTEWTGKCKSPLDIH